MEGGCRSYLVDFDFLFGSANDLDLCSVLGDTMQPANASPCLLTLAALAVIGHCLSVGVAKHQPRLVKHA